MGAINYKLIRAIEEKQPIGISYLGDSKISQGYRLIYPCVLGKHISTKNEVLRAWQALGKSASRKEEGWKLFLVDKITRVDLPNKKRAQFREPPRYNGRRDQHMGHIYAHARF